MSDSNASMPYIKLLGVLAAGVGEGDGDGFEGVGVGWTLLEELTLPHPVRKVKVVAVQRIKNNSFDLI